MSFVILKAIREPLKFSFFLSFIRGFKAGEWQVVLHFVCEGWFTLDIRELSQGSKMSPNSSHTQSLSLASPWSLILNVDWACPAAEPLSHPAILGMPLITGAIRWKSDSPITAVLYHWVHIPELTSLKAEACQLPREGWLDNVCLAPVNRGGPGGVEGREERRLS